MFDRSSQKSNSHAILFGHKNIRMGERSLGLKFQTLLSSSGYRSEVVDIMEWMGDWYEPFAQLNYELANQNQELLMESAANLPKFDADIYFILSWCWSVAAFFASGLPKHRPTLVKLYVHHPQERILNKLYESAELLITESPLANQKAVESGFSPEKILYIPHHYPEFCEKLIRDRTYAYRLAENQNKKITKHTKIIGAVFRLELGKNTEFALEAVRRLFEEGEDCVLILKGDFPEENLYPQYRTFLIGMLDQYKNAPWLLWDRHFSPYPSVIHEYASFDLLLHPSGAEGGSHVVIECLGLGIPTVVLDCSTNPGLFKGMATFAKTKGEVLAAQLPFYQPDLEDLLVKIHHPFRPNQELVKQKFHADQAKKRIPLLFSRDRGALRDLYEQDKHG